MSTPHSLGWTNVRHAILFDYMCSKCKKPVLSAYRSTCCHRMCEECARCNDGEKSTKPCPHCKQEGSWEADAEYSHRACAFVARVLALEACKLLSSQFPPPLDQAIVQHAGRFVRKESAQLDLSRLTLEMNWMVATLEADPLRSGDDDGDYAGCVTCFSLEELRALDRPGSVTSLTIHGSWLTGVDALDDFHSVRVLRLVKCSGLVHLSGLSTLPALRLLIVEECGVTGTYGIETCAELRCVQLINCANLTGVVLPYACGADSDQPDDVPRRHVVRVLQCPQVHAIAAAPSWLRCVQDFAAPGSCLTSLRALAMCASLKSLNLRGCRGVTDLRPLAGLQSIQSIDISDTDAADPLATLSDFPNLSELRVSGCAVEGDLTELRGAAQLKVLEAARTAITSLDGVATLVLLEEVRVPQCPHLVSLAALAGKHHLRIVDASNTAVVDVCAIDVLDALEELRLGHCARFRDHQLWTRLAAAQQLQIVDLRGCLVDDTVGTAWKAYPPNLRELYLSDCKHVRHLPVPDAATKLSIVVLDRTSVAGTFSLRNAKHLTRLDLSSTNIKDLAALIDCVACLESLELSNTRVKSISVLSVAANLRRLNLSQTEVRHIGALASSAPTLQFLALRKCRVANISVLAEAANLEEVYLDFTDVTDISPLRASAPRLRVLSLCGLKVKDFSLLHFAHSLTHVHLDESNAVSLAPLQASAPRLCVVSAKNCRSVSEIEVLWGATALTEAVLSGTSVSDISPLGACAPGLRKLLIDGCGVTDVSALHNANQLEIANFEGNPIAAINPRSAAAWVASVKVLTLSGCPLKSISFLVTAVRLEYLALENTAVAEVDVLANAASLEEILLTGSNVTDTSMLSPATYVVQ